MNSRKSNMKILKKKYQFCGAVGCKVYDMLCENTFAIIDQILSSSSWSALGFLVFRFRRFTILFLLLLISSNPASFVLFSVESLGFCIGYVSGGGGGENKHTLSNIIGFYVSFSLSSLCLLPSCLPMRMKQMPAYYHSELTNANSTKVAPHND